MTKEIGIRKNNWRSLLKGAAIIFAFMLVTAYCQIDSAFAASSISIGGSTCVSEGDTFTVSVTFSGDDIGRVDGQMTYDSSVISYISGGTSAGDNGYIELKDAGTGESLTFNIKFKAVGQGSSSISVSTNGIYNLEEEYVDAPSASSSITVESVEETSETTEETTEETEATTEEVTTTAAEEMTSELDSTDSVSEDTDDVDDGALTSLIPFVLMAILIIAIIVVAVALKNRSRRRRR